MFDGGLDTAEVAARFAGHVAELAGAGARVAVERVNVECHRALAARGLRLSDAEPLVEVARSIKSPGELECVLEHVGLTAVR